MSAVTMSAAQNSNKLGGGSNQDILDGEFLGLNHSPPQFTPSSYETSHFHKVRSDVYSKQGIACACYTTMAFFSFPPMARGM